MSKSKTDVIIDQLISLNSKIDSLDDRVDNVDKTLIKQELQLAEHIRRTNQNEQMIKDLRSDLKPVEDHVKYVSGGMKLLGLISLLAGILKLFNIV